MHLPRQGWSVVLRLGQKSSRDAQPWVQTISADHTVLKLQPYDVPGPLHPVGRVRVPRDFSLKDRRSRRALLTAMSDKLEAVSPDVPDTAFPSDEAVVEQIAGLRRQLKAHPCHACPDREAHAVHAAAILRLEREAARIDRQLDREERLAARRASAESPPQNHYDEAVDRAVAEMDGKDQ